MSQPGGDSRLLVVDELAAGYGDELVLDGISFAVEPGEILVILGGSGSGKSTALRCIVGLLTPARGRVLVRGRDVNAASGAERDEILEDIGMAFQNAALLNSMTVTENVALPILEHRRVDEETALMLARIELARVGLEHAGGKLPSELSGGMRKRAGLARALALEPHLLLFDEPSSGLDPITARALDDLILSLKERKDMGIIVVTHELASLNLIADRAVMLFGGKLIASGTLAEVKASPDPHVQAFFNRETLPHERHKTLIDELEWRE